MDDGNYVFTTRFFNGDLVRLVKINPSGEKIWERTNIPWFVNLHFVFRTQDDNIIQVSPYDPIGAYETYVSKFTTSGDLIWTKYPNYPLGTFEAKKGIETLNNELFFIGNSGTPHNAYPKLVKTDGEGNIICITADGCKSSTSAILEHPDGGFLFGCYDNNLLVTDSCGNVQQSIAIPGIYTVESIVPSDDDSLFIAGRLNRFDDFYFGKVNLDGDIDFIKKIDISPGYRVSLAKSLDGAIVIGIGSWLLKSFDFNEPFLVDLVDTNEVVQTRQSNKLFIHPNPNLGWITIQSEEKLPENTTLIVRDMLGQIVHMENPSWQCSENSCTNTLQVEGVPPGVYVVEVTGAGRRWTGKFVR